MECQECHQRPATLHFTQVVNGQKNEIYVCEVCAKEKGYMSYPTDGYSLHDLLTGLFNLDSAGVSSSHQKAFQDVQELECPTCNMTFSEFKRIGKFGCADCYETFAAELDPIFRRVHSGNTVHQGKIPKRQGSNLHVKKQLEQYKAQLQSLIEQEAFEKAAEVRDKIKELQKIADSTDKEAGDDA
ncbi:UvrB/UvrC motif-containing protein [Virgibacillus sp. 179-BFC.A HS]|uniref:UvrB/UvrC motif-containing protein n=1 Tax=Tigheibacillus jepli TaxID=3035914 RepID=A0ABU5CLS3_9BACI|nr:UvrB/UvrC motif-containing protein [Virgibacillus sp. 179-BFC.A HS]MDY0407313.1 UvrB/UvrC motif-containing protein [Virgibacillus sp. 179-BFC.A HS]